MKKLIFLALVMLFWVLSSFGNDVESEKSYDHFAFSLSLSQGSTGAYGVKAHLLAPTFWNETHLYFTAEDYVVNNSYYYNGEFTKSFHNIYALGFNYSRYYEEKRRLYLIVGGLLIVSDSRTHEQSKGYGGEIGIGYDQILTSKNKPGDSQTAVFFESLYRFTNIHSSKVSKKDFFNGILGSFGFRLYF